MRRLVEYSEKASNYIEEKMQATYHQNSADVGSINDLNVLKKLKSENIKNANLYRTQ